MSIAPRGMSIQEAYRHYRDDQLIVNRRYQRKLVWSTSEKAMLIDSILKGLMTVDKKHIVSYTISSSFERNDRYGQASSKTVSRRSSSP
jgi:hypothetical protein